LDILLNDYTPAILSLGVIGGLLLVQLLVADVLGIVKGHIPGTNVENDHNSVLFRAARAHANTNESIAIFIVLLLFALVLSADPGWINNLCIAYVAARSAHMCCYYADLRTLRSVFFVVGLLALIGMFLVAWAQWFNT